MSRKLLYLDSSAIVKLVVSEDETAALVDFLAGWPERVSSALAHVEVLRAVARAGEEEPAHRRAEEVLARISLIRIDDPVLSIASRLEPPELRTLDAIHLATALSVVEDLGGFVTYDGRMSGALSEAGMEALAPS